MHYISTPDHMAKEKTKATIQKPLKRTKLKQRTIRQVASKSQSKNPDSSNRIQSYIKIIRAWAEESVTSEPLPALAFKIAFGVGLAFFLLFLSTAPRLNVSYADSDELLAVAYRLGVAHPPGYPLYVLVLHFFTNLPIPGSVAFKGHVLSALLHGATITLLSLTLFKIGQFLETKLKKTQVFVGKRIDTVLFALIGSITLGLSFQFWLYGSLTEKYALASLLITASVFTLTHLLFAKETKTSHWLVFGLLMGTLIGNYQVGAFLLPSALLVVALRSFGNRVEKGGLFFAGLLLGVSLQILLLWFENTTASQVSWNFEPTLQGLFNHITMKDYADPNGQAGVATSAYRPQIDIAAWVSRIPNYISVVISHFGMLTFTFTLLGLYFLYRISKILFIVFVTPFFFLGILFPIYLPWPNDPGTQAVTMRHFIYGYQFVPLFVYFGWREVLIRQKKSGVILFKNKQYVMPVLVGTVGVYFASRLITTYPQTNLKDYTFISKFHQTLLHQQPKNAVLACFSDTTCFALLYEQQINNTRPDVTVIPAQYPLVAKKLASIPDINGFEYERAPYKIVDYLTWNIGKRPVTAVDLSREYYDLLGLNYSFTYYIPHGYWGELTREVPETFEEPDYSYSDEIRSYPSPKLDLMRVWFKYTIARLHTLNAIIFEKIGLRDRATTELNYASNILVDVPHVTRQDIEAQRVEIESGSPIANWKPGSKPQAIEEIWETLKIYESGGKVRQVFIGLLGILAQDPLNLEARLKLAEFYEKNQNYEFARIEYKNVLIHYPDNVTALTRIQELEEK